MGQRRKINSPPQPSGYPRDADRDLSPLNQARIEKTESHFAASVLFALYELVAIRPHDIQKVLCQLQIALKFGWNKGEDLLEKLHKVLKKKNYITAEYEIFKTHFLGKDAGYEKMKWNGQLNELAYVFDYLWDNRILPRNPNGNVTLSAHFLDQYDRVIGHESMRATRGKGALEEKKYEELESTLKEIFEN